MIDNNLLDIESLNDSLTKVIPMIQAIQENSAPAPFTYVNIIISLFAALFGLGSFFYAKKTADNVGRLSRKTQVLLCEDLIEDCLRYVVFILVALKRMTDKKWTIAEYFMDEIKYWPSDVYFKQEIFNNNSEIYKMIHSQKQRMEEYNESICIYQDLIKMGSPIHWEEEFFKLYRKNWETLFQAHEIYIIICGRNSKTIVEIYQKLKEKFIKGWENCKDEKLEAEYLKTMEWVRKDEIYNKPEWRKVESELINDICYCASLCETQMRMKEEMREKTKGSMKKRSMTAILL